VVASAAAPVPSESVEEDGVPDDEAASSDEEYVTWMFSRARQLQHQERLFDQWRCPSR